MCRLLLVFLFVPFGVHWGYILAGFLLFRLFDIWKPYPIDDLQSLPSGIGVCADDILAGVYAGVCLAVVGDAELQVIFDERVQDGVRNLVTDLVGMTLGN